MKRNELDSNWSGRKRKETRVVQSKLTKSKYEKSIGEKVQERRSSFECTRQCRAGLIRPRGAISPTKPQISSMTWQMMIRHLPQFSTFNINHQSNLWYIFKKEKKEIVEPFRIQHMSPRPTPFFYKHLWSHSYSNFALRPLICFTLRLF